MVSTTILRSITVFIIGNYKKYFLCTKSPYTFF